MPAPTLSPSMGYSGQLEQPPPDPTPPAVREEFIARARKALESDPIMSFRPKGLSEEEFQVLCAEIEAFNPTDPTEWALVTQIVVLSRLAMDLLAGGCSPDVHLANRLINSSHRAMDLLDRRRGRSAQNIAVTYNFQGGSKSVVQNRVG